MSNEMLALANCPIGLFLSQSGELCLKTEYGNKEGRIDAYIVSTGEFFWGSAPQTIATQRAQLVRPIDHERLLRSTAATVSRDREAIGRIINPDAFCSTPDPDEPEFWRKAARYMALEKADAILSLTPIGSGAGAMREACVRIAQYGVDRAARDYPIEASIHAERMAEEIRDVIAALPVPARQASKWAEEVGAANALNVAFSESLDRGYCNNRGDFDCVVREIERAGLSLSPVLVQLVQGRRHNETVGHALSSETKSGIVETERDAFIKAYPYLDHTEDKDAWGRPKFMHSHVDAMWAGWKRRAECGGAA